MRLLLVTRADEAFAPISRLTHPILKKYAKKWGADFIILSKNHKACQTKHANILYRILDIQDLLNEYDRVLNLDSDMVINKNCPNLFEIVPTDKIGVIFEDRGSRGRDRRKRISKIQTAWGDIGWRQGYINIGTFLVSQLHKQIFNPFKGQYWQQLGFADVHFGYQIHRLKFKIFELHWKYNHISMFSESWNGEPSRFNSHIIHYAGQGQFPDKGKRSRVQLIKDDISRIYG